MIVMGQTKIRSKQLEDNMDNKTFTNESWNTPTLLNSWENYGGSFDTCQYMKDSQGFVHIKGLIKTGTPPSDVFTLPSGYRPSSTQIFYIVGNTTLKNGEVRVYSDGDVEVRTSGSWTSLTGIYFKAS